MIILQFLFIFGVIGFFKALGSDLSNGASWLYSHTAGPAISFITGGLTNIVLSPFELFMVSATDAVLAFFGAILGFIETMVSGMVLTEESIALSLGLFGPVVAILVIVLIFAVVMVVIRVIIELL